MSSKNSDHSEPPPDGLIEQSVASQPHPNDTPITVLRTILVGSNKHPFTIHEDYLTNTSKYFRAACKEERSSAVPQSFNLPEVKPLIFDVYLNWCRNPNEDINTELRTFPKIGLPGTDDLEPSAITTLINLYIVSSFLMNRECSYAVFFSLHCELTKLKNHGPLGDARLATFAYANLPRENSLCMILRDNLVALRPEELGQIVAGLPKEVVEDVVLEQSTRSSQCSEEYFDFRSMVHYMEKPADEGYSTKMRAYERMAT